MRATISNPFSPMYCIKLIQGSGTSVENNMCFLVEFKGGSDHIPGVETRKCMRKISWVFPGIDLCFEKKKKKS